VTSAPVARQDADESQPGLEAAIAAWIADLDSDELPRTARTLALDGIRDCIAVAVAGSATEQARRVREVVTLLGGRAQASLLGAAARTTLTHAALVNGTAAHALDFDDTNHPLYGHPSSHLVPALLALAEWNQASGEDLLASYLVGFELEVRVARAVNPPHYVSGWHATATLGTLGAAAAGARLLALPASVTGHALGIAASLAGGLRENFGTDTKPLHAGLAAERGVKAVLLARAGLTASATALSGRSGFCSVLAGDAPPKLEELDAARFGEPWEITKPYGLGIKQFPCCAATHAAIEAALDAAGGKVQLGDIVRVRVGTDELGPRLLTYHRPTTGLEAKFSLEHCVAVALLDGEVSLDHFEDRAVMRPDVRALLPRIEPYIDGRIRTHTEYPANVELQLADGTRRCAQVDVARGKVCRPLPREALLAKYRACTERVLPPAQVARSLELIDRLPELRTLDELVAALSAAPGGDFDPGPHFE
jgi:2-methylcitrate dehydratase PrpD